MSRTKQPATTPLFDEKAAPPPTGQPDEATNRTDAEEMKRYGISCVPINYYHYRGFRYTSLKDAIAQARRS